MTQAKPPTRIEHQEAWVTKNQKRIRERAAEIRGTLLTDFFLARAQEVATEIIRDFEPFGLRSEARPVFANVILNPPTLNSFAQAEARRYKKQMGSMNAGTCRSGAHFQDHQNRLVFLRGSMREARN